MLYLLQLQALDCRALSESGHDPHTSLYKYCTHTLVTSKYTESVTVTEIFRNALYQRGFILFRCRNVKQTSELKDVWHQLNCWETYISIPLMRELYFTCYNEFEGINKHQLSRMYYNWKTECLEFSHTIHTWWFFWNECCCKCWLWCDCQSEQE